MRISMLADANHCGGTPKDRKNGLRTAGWTLLWAMCWVGAAALFRSGLVGPGAAGAAFVLLPTAVGVFMLRAYRRLIRESDELRRQIQLEALAATLGVTLIGSAAYTLLEQAGLIAEANVDGVILMMSITYVAALLISTKRYA